MKYTQEQVNGIVAYEIHKALASYDIDRSSKIAANNPDHRGSNGLRILEFMRNQAVNDFGTVVFKRGDLMRLMNKNRRFFEGINKNLPEGLTHRKLVYTYTK